jgi:hypothetical protein
MVIRQPPTLQVLISAEAVTGTDVPAERFPPVAAIHANDLIVAHGSPHRYSRNQNFVGLIWRSKLSKCSMYGGDEV